MRILYVSMDPGIHLSAPGGGAVHIRGFVRALAELGHEVWLLASSVAGAPEIQGQPALETGRILARRGAQADLPDPFFLAAPVAGWNHVLGSAIRGANRLVGRPGREHPDLVRILHNFTFRRAMEACVRSIAPELIYERYSLWGASSAHLAARRGMPYVLEVNAPLVYEQARFRGLSFPPLARFIERRVWCSAGLVVAVSEGLRPHLERAGVAADRILVVPNGVDPSVFHPDVDGGWVRQRLGLAGKFVIGASGTFKPWHGLFLLLEAFRQVHHEFPAAHLLVVGDGPLRPRLEDEVRRAGPVDAVTFTGNVPHEKMPAYLAAMDAATAAYPRLDQPYFSPLKLFEYMASGRPIVASRCGQAAEILSDGVTALLFEAGDREGLADCIRRLLRDPALRERLGRQAAEAGRAFTWRNNAARVLERLDHCGRCASASLGAPQEQTVG